MQIIWEGEGKIKITSEQNTIIINPNKKEEATVVLNPENNSDFLNAFSILNPGEYEVNDDFFYVDSFTNKNESKNHIYKLNIEGINIINLNKIDRELDLEANENGSNYENIIDSKVDLLILPIGEKYLTAKQAIDIRNELSPKIVIAINYDLNSDADKKIFEDFKKSFLSVSEPQDKFKIVKKNLPGNDDEIMLVILNQSK